MTSPRRPVPGPGAAVAVGTSVFVITAAAMVRVPLLPELVDALGAGAGTLGLLVAAFGAGRLLGNVPAGRLADRWSTDQMLACGAALVSAGTALLALAGTPVQAFAGSAVLGLGSSWANTTGLAWFSRHPDPGRRGRALSAFAVAFLGGQALGPAVGGLVGDLAGFRPGLLASAVASTAVVALVLTAPRALRRPRVVGSAGAPGRVATAAPGPTIPLGRWHRVAVYSLPLVQFTIAGAVMQTLVPVVGLGEEGLGLALLGWMLAVAGAARIAGALIAGWLADARGRRAALIPGLGLQSAGVGILMVPGTAALVAGTCTISLGAVGVSVGAAVLADSSPSAGVGRRLGVFRLIGDTGMLLGPALSGLLYERGGRVAALIPPFLLGVAALLLAAVRLQETHHPDPRPRQAVT